MNLQEQIRRLLRKYLVESDPKVGTGKKPKDSDRRLYTDENPKDTVSVKFRTKQDIVDTLNKESFKSKSHARQSQIINLIHQRLRVALERAKDPEVKKRLRTAFEYIESKKEQSKKKTQEMKEGELTERCWKGYTQKGMKTMFGKRYPNCVKNTKK
jgi:lysyl-tRNA synthetase class I